MAKSRFNYKYVDVTPSPDHELRLDVLRIETQGHNVFTQKIAENIPMGEARLLVDHWKIQDPK
jgi:hypothetical protein